MPDVPFRYQRESKFTSPGQSQRLWSLSTMHDLHKFTFASGGLRAPRKGHGTEEATTVSMKHKHQASQMNRALSTQSIIISKCSNFSQDMLLLAQSEITGFFPLILASLKWARECAKNLKYGFRPSFCSLTRGYTKLDFFFFLTILSPKFLFPR